ncbi:MAG: hypothetical protein AAFW75_18590, partial [Cyanobacteria bacterium J06636_16]
PENKLALIASQPNWRLAAPVEHGYISITAPNKAAHRWFLEVCSEEIESLASRFCVLVGYAGSVELVTALCKTRQVNSMTTDPATHSPLLQLGQKVRLTVPLLRTVELMLSDPSVSYSLVRLSDQAQVACNGGSSGQFLAGADLENVVTWTRDQYWHPGDLDTFNRDWMRELEPNSERWFEYSYRAINPGTDTDRHNPTMNLVSRYRLIDDGFGQLFHLGQNIELQMIRT